MNEEWSRAIIRGGRLSRLYALSRKKDAVLISQTDRKKEKLNRVHHYRKTKTRENKPTGLRDRSQTATQAYTYGEEEKGWQASFQPVSQRRETRERRQSRKGRDYRTDEGLQ